MAAFARGGCRQRPGGGLGDRITLRDQDVAALDDSNAYDCAWFPTFFVTEPVLEAAMPRLYRALHPGGWLVLGRMAPPPDPLAQAVSTLRIIRGGGADFDAKRLVAALEAVGCSAPGPGSPAASAPHPGQAAPAALSLMPSHGRTADPRTGPREASSRRDGTHK